MFFTRLSLEQWRHLIAGHLQCVLPASFCIVFFINGKAEVCNAAHAALSKCLTLPFMCKFKMPIKTGGGTHAKTP